MRAMKECLKLMRRRIVYICENGVPVICGVAPKRYTYVGQCKTVLDPGEHSVYALYSIGQERERRLHENSVSRYDASENREVMELAKAHFKRKRQKEEEWWEL
jgi:hypothetical protein